MGFQSGRLTVNKIFELESALPLSMVFPQIGAADLQQLKSWYWSDELTEDPATAAIQLSCHSYLLQIGGQNILIDTCNGNDKDRVVPFAHQLHTGYLDGFRATGVDPKDVDLVMCTHLHCDHVGWNTRLENGRWVPTFPNARYLFTRPDFEFFARHEDPVHSPAYRDSVLPVVEYGLAQIIETDHVVQKQIGDGVWLRGVPGHSPGSCVVQAQAGGELVLFSGDVFHHPLQLVRPDVHFFADEDPVMASAARSALFAEYADTAVTLFPAHFPRSSGGHIARNGSAYRYHFLPA